MDSTNWDPFICDNEDMIPIPFDHDLENIVHRSPLSNLLGTLHHAPTGQTANRSLRPSKS